MHPILKMFREHFIDRPYEIPESVGKVKSRLDPPIRLDKMTPEQQREFWKRQPLLDKRNK